MRSESENGGPCECCDPCVDECCGFWCCPLTGEVVEVVSCAELEEMPCEESSSDSIIGTPCSECFGPGTPNPDASSPATLTATYTDQGGIFDSFVNDDNWDYQCGDSVLEGLLNASAHLCGNWCAPGEVCSALILNQGFAGPLNETIVLTIISCSPFLAFGESVNFGHVVVSE